MLKNYFTIALRSLRKRLGTTALNVVGLAVGLACCLLISLYVLDELSYDEHHEKGDRVVRLALEPGGGRVLTVTPTIAGPILTREFPEVETYVRFTRPSEHTMRFEDRPFQREVLTYADSTVFDIFTLPFVHGTADGALTRPNTIVLTASVAQRHFGDRNPVGETLTVDGDRTFEVTGVIEDLPPTTHLSFDAVAAFETLSWADREIWSSANFHTYLLLQSEAAIGSVERKIPGLIERELGEQTGEFKMHIALQQLPRIHLYANGYITYVYIFGAIALLILLIACINFMNLATARSAERAKEVGVRKTLGAVRPSLVGQFLTEAVLLALFAAVLALILAELALPAFRTLAGKALSTHVLTNPGIVGAMLGLAVVVGLAAGSYPAFVLARFRPVQVLKGSFSTGRQGSTLRKTLVVVQFAVSVALIAGTAVVFQQLDYVQSTNLGFDKEQTIVLPLEEESTFTTLKQTLGQAPGVQHVSAVSTIP
ncbi:MAG: FtsX-like permease family protein, partial [Bacteroidetes bacterium]|nr:FtsX-like permease family protein [Bacteroidota bacterium]